MLIKFLCWLLGHKFVVKASNGDTFKTINQLTGLEQTGHYYVWEAQRLCTRCGEPNPNYEKTRRPTPAQKHAGLKVVK